MSVYCCSPQWPKNYCKLFGGTLVNGREDGILLQYIQAQGFQFYCALISF